MNIVPHGAKHRSQPAGTDIIAPSSAFSGLSSSLGFLKKRYLAILSALALVAAPVASLALSPAHGPTNNALSDPVQATDLQEAAAPASPAPAAADADSGGRSASTAVHSMNGHTSVTINGRTVPVPDNGSVHQTIPNADGQTSVDVSASGSGNTSSVTTQVTTSSGGSSGSTQVFSNSTSSNTNTSSTQTIHTQTP